VSGLVQAFAPLGLLAVLLTLWRPSAFRWAVLGAILAVTLIAARPGVYERGGVFVVGISMVTGALLTLRWLQSREVAPFLALLGAGAGVLGGLLVGLALAVNLGLLTP
jgi:hypothetical protein